MQSPEWQMAGHRLYKGGLLAMPAWLGVFEFDAPVQAFLACFALHSIWLHQ